MKSSLTLLLVAAGSILFNLFFWHEKVALNAVLFDVFILAALWYIYPATPKPGRMRWLIFAHLVTVAAVLIQNTHLSKTAFCTTLLLVVVFWQYTHRSPWYAAASVFMNYVQSPLSFASHLRHVKTGGLQLRRFKSFTRFLLIPSLLLILFFSIYIVANPVFHSIIQDINIGISSYFSGIFEWFSWQRFWFLVLGFFITTGLLMKSSTSYFSERDTRKTDRLVRSRTNPLKARKTPGFELLSLFMGKFATGMLALRNEHTTGQISLIVLNVLLLFINCLDVVYVWFGFETRAELSLSQYVHEGTDMLIFSILLAIVVLLFFFRGNLNFYNQNKGLRYGAYAWLIQNAVLAISVFFRDYYYIQNFGLTYKRIGVLIFLSLVLCGLVTVFIKINQRKTAYFLLRVNAWCAIITLVACSCIHWDEQIAKYNLARKDRIAPDVEFLLTLSDKALPLLEKNKDVFHTSGIAEAGSNVSSSELSAWHEFEDRKQTFTIEQARLSWLSWNYADAITKKELQGQPASAFNIFNRKSAGADSSTPLYNAASGSDIDSIFPFRGGIVLRTW